MTNSENNITVYNSQPLGGGRYEITPQPKRTDGWGLVLDFYNPRAAPSNFETFNCLTYNGKVIIVENNGIFYYPYTLKYNGHDRGIGYSRIKIGGGKYTFKTFAWHVYWHGWIYEQIPKKDVSKFVPNAVLKAMGY